MSQNSIVRISLSLLCMILGALPVCGQDDDPVSVKAVLTADKDNAGRFVLSVELEIGDGWHTYDKLPEGNPSPSTSVKLDLPEGVTADGKWTRPVGFPYEKEAGMTVFEGTAKFSRTIVADGFDKPRSIGVKVKYQVCDENKCLPPTTQETKVELPPVAMSGDQAGVKKKTRKILKPPSGDNDAADVDSGAKVDSEPFEFKNELFEAPIRLMVGDKPLNSAARQKYPSPNLFDVDGDGDIELIVGDIFGSLNVYENSNENKHEDPVWESHVGLKNADGDTIKVSNW